MGIFSKYMHQNHHHTARFLNEKAR